MRKYSRNKYSRTQNDLQISRVYINKYLTESKKYIVPSPSYLQIQKKNGMYTGELRDSFL